MDETPAQTSTAVVDAPADAVSPIRAPSFPAVALGERPAPPVETKPAAPAATQEPGQQTDSPEEIPDDLLDKFEKHPKFQSRVDKTVAKALQTAEQRWQASQAEAAALKARQEADAEYEAMLEQVANGTFVDEGTQSTARKALLQRVQATTFTQSQNVVLKNFQAQAEAAYQAIPEFANEEVLSSVRKASSVGVGEWLTAVTAGIRAEVTKELEAKWEQNKGKLAEALKEDVRGEERARMRIPDTGRSSVSARANNGYQSLEDAELALMEGRITTGQLRALTRVLPRRGRAA